MSDASETLERASTPLVMRCRDGLELVGRDGSLRRLEGDTAALAETLLAFCEPAPRSRAAIRAHVEALTGAPLAGSSVVDELVTLLRDVGALARPIASARPARTSARVVVGMGGAVAAAHAPLLVQALIARGLEVRVIASERALRFVAREALEALTHAPVLSSMWPDDGDRTLKVPHVELAAWADVVVVWPATATMIGRIATGDCSELVSAVAITTRAPVLVAPSMNEAMLDAASVARNLGTLAADGIHVAATTLAHEVAETPGERTLTRGGAPDPELLASMVHALARASIPHEPRDAASWEAFHRRVPEAEQAWVTDTADETVMACLEAHAPTGGSLWEIGTGHGAIAIAAAARGYRVVATDLSETALRRAGARAPGAQVVWMRDDVTASALIGEMDVIVDRGTLHTLPLAQRAAYASGIAARTRAGSIVIVTVHTPPGDARVRAHTMSAEEIASTLGPRFELLESVVGTFAGSLVPAPPSVTSVFRRR